MKQTEDTKCLLEFIKKSRKEKKLRQKDVADILGISRSRYSQIENGTVSCSYYIDDIINILGREVMNYFPYDIEYYTNRRLLIYMLVFGVTYKEVAQTFHLKIHQIRQLVYSKRKKYIIQYKNEIESLFPLMHTIKDYGEIQLVGKNSISIEIDGKYYVFPNIIGRRKEKDTVYELMYSQ